MSPIILLFLLGIAPDQPGEAANKIRIAFGSCNKANKPQPMWDPILRSDPHIWIWTGDIIYGDTESMSILRAKYNAQKKNQGYRRLMEHAKVLGIWDDHDYGLNNGGREYRQKSGSQRELLDFLDVPADSPRRRQKGAYGSHLFGSPGALVKVILLDARYHRAREGRGAILGRAQWLWLERELRTSPADVHLIVSGIQVVPVDHEFEKWANFPKGRKRLIQMIADLEVPGVIFISGDRHFAEISMIPDSEAGYPLFDVTSSGLTHSYLEYEGEPNRHRVGDMFTDLNFGLIEIDWSAKPVAIELQIRDIDNRIRLSESLSLDELRTGPAND